MSSAVGQPLERIDGRLKITGGATYAAEFHPDRVAHAVLVQSTIPKGRIASIDLSAARKAPGVLTILTHENAPKLQMPKPSESGGPSSTGRLGEMTLPLWEAVIHFAGQNIAVVVAEKLEQAQHAAALVRVRYESEKPILEIPEAESTATFPEKFLGRPVQYRRGDVDKALTEPNLVFVEQTYTTPVETNNPMEPHATLAQWNGDRLTVEDATQAVMGCRDTLAKVFAVPHENVRVHCPFTGGGFGSKGSQWQHTLIAAMA